MGFVQDLFANKQKQQSSQSGTSNTQSNYWNNPELQNFLQGYNQQYSSGNINSVQAPVNAWQTGAVGNQAGLATGLGGAFNAANNAAATGIDPNRINQFMSPYIQSVVNPTLQAQDIQNKQALSNLRGNQASRGALGNNTGAEAAYMAGVQPGQQAQIASLYNQGFGQAAGLTAQDVQSRLACAGAVGALTGVGTGANQAQFGMGEGIRQAGLQNQMTPFQLWNQGLAGQQLAGGLSGQNTTSSSQGTSTTTQTPGLGQSIMCLAGMGMGLFGGGGFFPSMFGGGGGSTMPGTAANGGWSTTTTPASSWGWWRDGGAVKGYNSGGSVMEPFHPPKEDFAAKVVRAFETVQKMRASGGRTEKKEEGAGRFAEPRINAWPATMRPYQGERLPFELATVIPPYVAQRPLVFDLPRYEGGGSVLPSAWEPFGGFNANNSTEEGASFAANPFAQFPNPMGGEFPAERTVIPPFNPNAETTAGVMEAYDPAPVNPATRVAGSAYTRPPASASALDIAQFRPERTARLEEVHPHQRAAAWMMAASGPSVLGPGGEAMLKQHQENLNKYRVETEAANQANALQQRLMQHQADMEHRREQLALQQAELAERERHNRRVEDMRSVSRPETAYDVGEANAAVKLRTEFMDSVRTSQTNLARYGEMERLANNPNVTQGQWGEWALTGKKAAQALGFNVDGVPESEALRSISNQLALSLRNPAGGEGMPGALSNQDREFLQSSVPGLNNTASGNKLIIRMGREREEYKLRQNREAMRYIQQNKTRDGLEEHMQHWAEANPMFSRETYAEAERIGAQAPPPRADARTQTATGSVWSRTTPENQQKAIGDLRKAAGSSDLPRLIKQFNDTFNGGQPGLAEQFIEDESQAFRERQQYDLNAPHNMLRRWFGQSPT